MLGRGTELQDTRRVKDMIKKTLFLGAAVLLLAVLFFGRGAVSYVTTAVDRVQDQVKSNVPVNNSKKPAKPSRPN